MIITKKNNRPELSFIFAVILKVGFFLLLLPQANITQSSLSVHLINCCDLSLKTLKLDIILILTARQYQYLIQLYPPVLETHKAHTGVVLHTVIVAAVFHIYEILCQVYHTTRITFGSQHKRCTLKQPVMLNLSTFHAALVLMDLRGII